MNAPPSSANSWSALPHLMCATLALAPLVLLPQGLQTTIRHHRKLWVTLRFAYNSNISSPHAILQALLWANLCYWKARSTHGLRNDRSYSFLMDHSIKLIFPHSSPLFAFRSLTASPFKTASYIIGWCKSATLLQTLSWLKSTLLI